MKFFLTLLILINGGLAWAQTNAQATTNAVNITPAKGLTVKVAPVKGTPKKNVPDQLTDISSASGHYDGNAHQMVYLGHVLVLNAQSKLRCERLTVNMPADGGQPTNVVAETNVVIDMLDDQGQTNHITADRAVYNYTVINAVTNEVVTFSGGNPEVQNPKQTIWGDPLVLDMTTKQYSGTNYHMIFRQSPSSSKGTNTLNIF